MSSRILLKLTDRLEESYPEFSISVSHHFILDTPWHILDRSTLMF